MRFFIGTDATENWNKMQFQAFYKLDRGKAWNSQQLRGVFILINQENGMV
jgi:hypothetical protein